MGRNVLFLGLTSMFTDISAEMVATVLPLYLLFGLRLTPFQLGLVDGLYQGASVLVRVASGVVADRLGAPKGVALTGYGLSAATKVGFAVVPGPWPAIAGLVLVDRIGKGIRTAPRDALISLSTAPSRLATAFGVHRALDTAGAMAGPLVAFAILLVAPRAFDAVFVVSFCFALVGAAVLAAFVRAPSAGRRQLESDDRPSLRTMAAMLRSRRFLTIAVVAAALGLATVSDSLLYIVLQQRLGLDLALFPLLFVGTALAFMVLAIPLGRVADQVGRFRTFMLGYVVLAAAYLLLLAPAFGALQALLVVTLLGTYYAMTDGVLMALASTVIPSGARASGLGIIATASSLGRLIASVVFGTVWTLSSIETATATFAGLLIVAIAISALLVRRWENSGDVEVAAPS